MNIFRHLHDLRKSGRLWSAGIVAGMSAFVAVNLAFMTVALRHSPQLVSENAYADGANLKDVETRRTASITGWKISVIGLPRDAAEQPLVEVRISQRNGTPCDSLKGTAVFFRASNKSLDVSPAPLRFIGEGRYLVVLPRPLERGAWQTVLRIERATGTIEQRANLFVYK